MSKFFKRKNSATVPYLKNYLSALAFFTLATLAQCRKFFSVDGGLNTYVLLGNYENELYNSGCGNVTAMPEGLYDPNKPLFEMKTHPSENSPECYAIYAVNYASSLITSALQCVSDKQRELCLAESQSYINFAFYMVAGLTGLSLLGTLSFFLIHSCKTRATENNQRDELSFISLEDQSPQKVTTPSTGGLAP